MTNNLTEQFLTLQEFIEAAHQKLPDNAWAYIVGGTETETTLRRNRQSLDELALRPRVLNDVSDIDCSTKLFGRSARLPVLLCPVGGLESFDPDGALAVAQAAKTFGIPMMLSSVSDWTPESLVEKLDNDLSLIVQLYAREDAAQVDALVDRCSALDLPAFCITVDSAIYSRRERDIIARFQKPWRAKGQGNSAHYQAALNWNDIKRIRSRYDKPIILKGIATAEDATIAIDHGVDIIYVSNHGGRQLDHALGSTAALPDIVQAVDGRARVVVDGSFSRGTDIVKALALGADGVGLGRLMCFALAAAGSEGIVRMLEILEEEVRIALGLLGVTCISELNASHVCHTNALSHANHMDSAFPLLRL